MEQFFIRDKDLIRKIRALARHEGISLNQAAIQILRRGAGLADPESAAKIGDALDNFIGSWSAEDERAILESIATVEQVGGLSWIEPVP